MVLDPLLGFKAQTAVNAATPTSADIGGALVRAIQIGQQFRSNQLSNEAKALELDVAKRTAPLKITAAQTALRQADLQLRRTEQAIEATDLELSIAQQLQPLELEARRSALLAEGFKAQSQLEEMKRRESLRASQAVALNDMEVVARSPLLTDEEQTNFISTVQPELERIQKDREALVSASKSIAVSPGAFKELDDRAEAIRGQFNSLVRDRATARVSSFFDFVETNRGTLDEDPTAVARVRRLRQELSDSPVTQSAFNEELARRNAPPQFAGDPEVKALAMARLRNLGRAAQPEDIAAIYAVAGEQVQQGRVFERFGENADVARVAIDSFTAGTNDQYERNRAYLLSEAQRGEAALKQAIRAKSAENLPAEAQRSYVSMMAVAQGLGRVEEQYAELVRAVPELRDGTLTGKQINNILKKARSQNPSIAELETTMGATVASFVQSISGAAVTDAEFNRLSSLFPDWDKGEEVFAANLQAMRSYLNDRLRATAVTSGLPERAVDYAFEDLLVSRDTGLDTDLQPFPEGTQDAGFTTPAGNPLRISADGQTVYWREGRLVKSRPVPQTYPR